MLQCCAAHPRRISSVLLFLTFPDNDVSDLHPIDDLGPKTSINVETTDNRETEFGVSVALKGATAGAEYNHEVENVESTTRVTRMTIKGVVKGSNTASWSLVEDVGQKGGLPIQVPMRFSLGYKPDRSLFTCRVTSEKNGKVREQYGYQRYPPSRTDFVKEGLSSFFQPSLFVE
ncbi:hypothetical protein BDZ94DRAFT_1274646 [Collybia nuda]|uniref:Uncharacterized protein n=1 Tax=Collybia nuda TaxID=64659 RepID=A0A9P6CC82_9AGAR|nr:hypothetical protein BDZ94DRAFT_1274646 [Collybia nuda]